MTLLHDIARAASERAGKNAGVAPELLYAPILWVLQDSDLPLRPTPEPVAWRWHWKSGSDRDREWEMWTYSSEQPRPDGKIVQPLYAAPIQSFDHSQAKEPEANAADARSGDGAMGSSRHVAGRTATTTSENLDVTAGETAPNSIGQRSLAYRDELADCFAHGELRGRSLKGIFTDRELRTVAVALSTNAGAEAICGGGAAIEQVRAGADAAGVREKRWSRRNRGTAIIHTHPDAFEERAIVENIHGIHFNGIEYQTLEAAKSAALSQRAS